MTQLQAGETRGNILVVDDTPANLRLLGAMLSDQGYKVRAVVNGEMALTAARSAPPDLILLDINMPDMSGYEVCRALKADERTSAIPVIFVSALDEALDKVKAFEVGGVDYITKPVQFEEVVMRVSTHLKLHRLQQAGGRAGGGGDDRLVPPALAALLGRPVAADLWPGDSATFEGALLVAVARHEDSTVAPTAAVSATTASQLLGRLGAIAAGREGLWSAGGRASPWPCSRAGSTRRWRQRGSCAPSFRGAARGGDSPAGGGGTLQQQRNPGVGRRRTAAPGGVARRNGRGGRADRAGGAPVGRADRVCGPVSPGGRRPPCGGQGRFLSPEGAAQATGGRQECCPARLAASRFGFDALARGTPEPFCEHTLHAAPVAYAAKKRTSQQTVA